MLGYFLLIMSDSLPLKVAVQLTLLDIYRALIAVAVEYRTYWNWTLTALKAVIACGAVYFAACLLVCGKTERYLSLLWTSLQWSALFLAGLTPLLLLILPPVVLKVLAWRKLDAQRPVTYSFFPDRIETRTAPSGSTIQWSSFVRIRETKGQFLLYFQRHLAFVLPKRCFGGDAQIQAFRELVRASFPGEALLRR